MSKFGDKHDPLRKFGFDDQGKILKIEPTDFDDFASMVEDYWDSSMGSYHYDKERKILRLATGGWSENEATIMAIECNHFVMMRWWYLSMRGGLYIFREDRYR